MQHCVFIHTNHKQIVGALAAEQALRRYSKNNEKFEVRIIHHRDYPFFRVHEGQLYLRDGVMRPWLNEDLQSFTPLRFMPPELMNYTGRAVVIDPDVFAVSDVWELLSRDMRGKAILCRRRSGPKGYVDRCLASSVMLLDCAQLKHWNVKRQFEEMFRFTRDYQPWIGLKLEPREIIGMLEHEWNDFDKLTGRTRMLHNTRRRTQPWKAGLPIDWRPAEKFRAFPPAGWLMRVRRKLFGEYGLLGHYRPHPDMKQEQLFFGLVQECLDAGTVTETMLRDQMVRNHVRHDALEVLERTPPLPAEQRSAA